MIGRSMKGETKYTKICGLRALDRGWRLLPTDPHNAIKLRRTPSWKESRLAVTVLRSSSESDCTDQHWERLVVRVNYEFKAIFYPNQTSPRTMATHLLRGATEPIALGPDVETELSMSPFGAPIIFVLNGHESMSTKPAHWSKYSVANPHLTIFIAIRMPSEDIKDSPTGIWSTPFPGSNYCWCMHRLDDLLNKANDEVPGRNYILGLWSRANAGREKLSSGYDGVRHGRNFRRRTMIYPVADSTALEFNSRTIMDSEYESPSDDGGDATDDDR